MKKMGRHELLYRQELLLNVAKALPQFDMNWSEDERKLWFDLHREIILQGLELAQIEDANEASECPKTRS